MRTEVFVEADMTRFVAFGGTVRRGVLAVVWAGCLVAAGCAVEGHTLAPPGPEPPAPPARVGRWSQVGTSVEGRAIRAWFAGSGDRRVLYVGAIHGNESAGVTLLEGLIARIEAQPGSLDGHEVIVLPAANPDGLAADSRTNANGVDLNRGFPTDNFRPGGTHGRHPGSEPEVRAIIDLIVDV